MNAPDRPAELLDVALLTVRVAGAATAAIALPALVVGWLLSRWRSPLRPLLRAVVALPMVLPPVAVGLLLLLLLARDGPLGRLLAAGGIASPLLTWRGAAIASGVMAFPLLAFGAQQGFDAVPRRLEQVAATLGASRWRILAAVTLPHAARGIAWGFVLAFARGLGEFGATALVAGRIPGETETLALAIDARIHLFEDDAALRFALVSLALALAATIAAELVLRRERR